MADITVMLIDDHAVVRVGFRMLLEAAGGIRVVAEADTGEDGYRLQETVAAAVILMDLSMPGAGGVESVRRLVQRDPSVRVLVLSAHEDAIHAQRALRAGASGYLSKRGAPEELIEAVRTLAAGRVYIEAGIARTLAMQEQGLGDGAIGRLTEREFAVFMQLANGRSVQRIAELLSISPNTAGTHLYNIKQKLAADNQAELTLIALRHGLIQSGN